MRKNIHVFWVQNMCFLLFYQSGRPKFDLFMIFSLYLLLHRLCDLIRNSSYSALFIYILYKMVPPYYLDVVIAVKVHPKYPKHIIFL